MHLTEPGEFEWQNGDFVNRYVGVQVSYPAPALMVGIVQRQNARSWPERTGFQNSLPTPIFNCGALAHLGERRACNAEAVGS